MANIMYYIVENENDSHVEEEFILPHKIDCFDNKESRVHKNKGNLSGIEEISNQHVTNSDNKIIKFEECFITMDVDVTSTEESPLPHVPACPQSNKLSAKDSKGSLLNEMNKKYKACFVPLCRNTTKKSPDKLFFHVPTDVNKKKKWFQAAHRNFARTKTHYYCCEDHFDIEHDVENIVKLKMYGGPRILKSGIIPHKFECQPNRILITKDLNRPAYRKINRKRDINEILRQSKEKSPLLMENTSKNIKAVASPSSSKSQPSTSAVDNAPKPMSKEEKRNVSNNTGITINKRSRRGGETDEGVLPKVRKKRQIREVQ